MLKGAEKQAVGQSDRGTTVTVGEQQAIDSAWSGPKSSIPADQPPPVPGKSIPDVSGQPAPVAGNNAPDVSDSPTFPIDRVPPSHREKMDIPDHSTDRPGRVEQELDKATNPLLSDDTRATMEKINAALTHGDVKSLADQLDKYKDDPKKLEALVNEVQSELKKAGSDVSVTTKDGIVSIESPNGTIVELNPRDGSATVKHRDAKTGKVRADLDTSPTDAMREISDGLVDELAPTFNFPKQKEPLPWPGSKVPRPDPQEREPFPLPVPRDPMQEPPPRRGEPRWDLPDSPPKHDPLFLDMTPDAYKP